MTQALNKEPKPREVSDRVNQMLKGALNNTGAVTLTPSTTTTTVLDPNVHKDSKIFLTPQTSNAASGNAHIKVGDITEGQFIITHSSSGSSDKTFLYAYLG